MSSARARRIIAGVALAALLFAGGAAQACAPVPAPVIDLDIPRFYGDAKGTIVEPKQKALHDAAVKPLTDFVREVTSDADKAMRRAKVEARAEAASCALGALAAWAEARAFLGTMAQDQAEYQRKWDLAGLALAYIKLKPYATAAQRQAIEPWLFRFADASRKFFDDPKHKRNNHWYWLGLGLGATAIATGSDRHWQAARGIMADAARDIAADGTLPMELARGGRAIHYHAFALMPLVVLAELGAARGENWYALGDGALHRLVDITIAGLADVSLFDRLAGVPQQRPVGEGAGWLQLYAARFPERVKGKPVLPDTKPGHRWIGGDVTLLAEALSRSRMPAPVH